MKKSLLISNRYKKLGWVLLVCSLFLWILVLIIPNFSLVTTEVYSIYSDKIFGGGEWFGKVESDLAYTIIGVLTIVGGLLVGFSKEKHEDEYIQSMRLNALLWAVLISYSVLLFSFLTVYGLSFLYVLSYQMFSVLIIFILRFHYLLRKNRKEMELEE